MNSRTPVFIACGVLRREIEQILHEEYPDAEAVFLNSMLHMRPQKLRETLDAELSRHDAEPVVLVYGDCHAWMHETCQREHCARSSGINCCELLLGHDRYRQLQRENVFIFLPEWTERWREVFAGELGLADRTEAGRFMRDMRSALVYLDTGMIPVPASTLREIESHFGMPVTVLPVSVDGLRATIRTAVQKATV